MIIFILQALAYIFLFPVITDPIPRFLILSLNVLISVFLGWRLYKRMYHMVFTYDNKGFTLQKGNKEEANRRWKEFSKVSLVRTEQGDLSVRLYKNAEFFDLPTSKLKLNPFDFRLEVMRLVSANRDRR
jgi:hypothetical protein